jgi:flagellar basal body rod protein FlgG
MNIGLYQGAASMAASEKLQAIVSQHIASSSVPGFRKSEPAFATVLGDATRSDSGATSNGVMPQLTDRISMRTGELRNTGNETDFAIDGPGFFQIQRTDGTNGYTRDGEFRVNADRILVNKHGHPVMGDGGPITFRPGGGRISINPEGSILQGDIPVAKLPIYEFADPQVLRRVEDGMLAPKDGSAPQPMERASVLTSTLEGSNVKPLEEMVNLITIARSYESSQRVITAHDEAADKAIQILGNPN